MRKLFAGLMILVMSGRLCAQTNVPMRFAVIGGP